MLEITGTKFQHSLDASPFGIRALDVPDSVKLFYEVETMFLELARPVALLSCLLALCALFHTAFLVPSTDMHQRIYDSLDLLALAAITSLAAGLIFRDLGREPNVRHARLTATLPIQVFCWSSSTMLLLFVLAWYLETHCVFYRDIRF